MLPLAIMFFASRRKTRKTRAGHVKMKVTFSSAKFRKPYVFRTGFGLETVKEKTDKTKSSSTNIQEIECFKIYNLNDITTAYPYHFNPNNHSDSWNIV